MECLHRFCAPCLEESVRRFNRHCPVCRSPIPNKRCLAVDRTVDHLVRSLLGGIEEAAAVPPVAAAAAAASGSASAAAAAAGEASDPPSQFADRTSEAGDGQSDGFVPAPPLDEAASSLQHAIHHKRLQQLHHLGVQQQRLQSSSPSSLGDEQPRRQPVPPPSVPTSRAADDSRDPRVLVELRRHDAERDLDELLLPHLRLSERAPLRVIVTFLRHKLGLVAAAAKSRRDSGEGADARNSDKDERAADPTDVPTSPATKSPGGDGDGLVLYLSKRKFRPADSSKKKERAGDRAPPASPKGRVVTLTDRNDHSLRGVGRWDATTLRELRDRYSIKGTINLLYKKAE
jgi:hypothetical protein